MLWAINQTWVNNAMLFQWKENAALGSINRNSSPDMWCNPSIQTLSEILTSIQTPTETRLEHVRCPWWEEQEAVGMYCCKEYSTMLLAEPFSSKYSAGM